MRSMSTYVLVHGAWSGGWVWRDVTRALRAASHEAIAVTLTGLGERSHLATPEIGLSTHIDDVVNVLEFEDLRDVVLVGHSYAGMVITGVADRVSGRLNHLVYLDAHLPQDGQSWADLTGARQTDDAGPIPPPALPPNAPPPTAAEQAMMAKLVPQPRQTTQEKLRLRMPTEDRSFKRTYIKAVKGPRATVGPGAALWSAAERVQSDPAWNYREIDTGHMVQVEKPDELATLLLDILK